MWRPITILKQGKGVFRSIQTSTSIKRKFKDGGQHATFNDMPIPQGCWYEANARRQRRYMSVFISGLSSLVATIVFIGKSDLIFFNYTVPDYPYEDEE